MSSPNDHRLTHITPDDHQRWLWFVHICCPSLVVIVGCLRIRRKLKRPSLDDALLALAHLVYLGYWLLALFAMLNGLGKSENLASHLERAHASKFIFWSRILLVLVVCLVKASIIYLIKIIFTSNFKAIIIWYWTIVAATVAEALLGSLMISAGCSPSGLLEAPNNNACSNNVARWVTLTTIESIFEFILVIPVASTVWNIQFSVETKMKVTAAFLCRLIVWAPIWTHASMYISFIRSATSSIDVVPTIVTEELWVAISLVSASLPLIISDMGKFSTLGMQLGTASINNSSNKSGTRDQHPPPAPSPEYDEYGEDENESAIVLRPAHDRGRFSASVLSSGPSQSVCTTESRMGILREVSFESSSWHTGGEAGYHSPP